MSPLNLTEGTLFAGRYRVVRCVAHGGMGAVYEVIHLETERRRALKVMLPHLVQSAELRDRFRREARVAAQIESAYIVDVFDAGIDDQTGMPFLVMELLKGEEVGKRLERLGRLPQNEVVQYLWQTSLALDKTHKANIVHRDLKPENLFLHEQEDAPPRIKVLDFGIAKIVAENGTHANATRSVGTPLYMAPEQFKPGSQVFPATDIYSLGMVAYTLLVGAPYWDDEQRTNNNVFAFVTCVMHGPTEKATARAARRGVVLPSAFDAWFAKVTNAKREERYPTATAAIAALAEALGVPMPGESSRTFNAAAMLQVDNSRIQTVKLMPDIRAALKAGELAVASPPKETPIANATPAPRPPLPSVAATEYLSPTSPPQTAARSQPGLPAMAPPLMPISGPAQTGPSGALGVGVTRPTVTPPKKRNTPVVLGIVGVFALIGVGGAIWGSGSRKTESTNANLASAHIESNAVAIAPSVTASASATVEKTAAPLPVASGSAAPTTSVSTNNGIAGTNQLGGTTPPPKSSAAAVPTGTAKVPPRGTVKNGPSKPMNPWDGLPRQNPRDGL